MTSTLSRHLTGLDLPLPSLCNTPICIIHTIPFVHHNCRLRRHQGPDGSKPHRVVNDHRRFHTDREVRTDLPLEDDAFMFAVFGDRTGGSAAGISVLREAVADVNLIEPDFVMTVGDLIDIQRDARMDAADGGTYQLDGQVVAVPWRAITMSTGGVKASVRRGA